MSRLQFPLFALLLSVGTFALHGCNTIEGAGEDVENTGEAIQDTAEEAEEDISD